MTSLWREMAEAHSDRTAPITDVTAYPTPVGTLRLVAPFSRFKYWLRTTLALSFHSTIRLSLVPENMGSERHAYLSLRSTLRKTIPIEFSVFNCKAKISKLTKILNII